jgi:hypothetical protein
MKFDKIVVIAVIAFMVYLLLRGHSVGSEHSISANLFGIGNVTLDAGFSYCNIHTQPMESSTCAIPLAADYLPCNYCHVPAISTYSARMVCDNARAQRSTQTPAAVCSFNKASSLPYGVGVVPIAPGPVCYCAEKLPATICVEPTQQGGLI